MARLGLLIREARGLYRLADSEFPGNPDLVQLSLLMPKSVIFLVSALFFHDLTTQIPHRVDIALPQGVKERQIDYPPLRVFHLSPKVYGAGIEDHIIDGVLVRVYDREKTVTDCFKYRRKIGQDVALEALKDYMRQPYPDVGRLMKYARINRVEKLMRPYVESLL